VALIWPHALIADGEFEQPRVGPWEVAGSSLRGEDGAEFRCNGRLCNRTCLPLGNSSLLNIAGPRKGLLAHGENMNSEKSDRVHGDNLSLKDMLSRKIYSLQAVDDLSAAFLERNMDQFLFNQSYLSSVRERPSASNFETFASRLNRLRAKRENLSQEKLSELLGLQELQVGRWERGEAEPRPKNLAKLAQFFNVPASWLQYGGSGGPIMIPIVGIVGAGQAVMSVDDEPLGEIEAPYGTPADMLAAEVRGDSNLPDLQDHDILLYRGVPQEAAPLIGQRCMVRTEDGHVMVKRLRHGIGPTLFDLDSSNAPTIPNQRLVWCAKIEATIHK
jgi:transcriptional regulator with XRE-family HTH domain